MPFYVDEEGRIFTHLAEPRSEDRFETSAENRSFWRWGPGGLILAVGLFWLLCVVVKGNVSATIGLVQLIHSSHATTPADSLSHEGGHHHHVELEPGRPLLCGYVGSSYGHPGQKEPIGVIVDRYIAAPRMTYLKAR